VKDNGQGVDPDILPRLFTEFAPNSAIGGTGLRLYFLSIVEAYSGGIWAQNTMDGKRAAFSFSLSTINNHRITIVIIIF
jgi:signal transduction histidine kinase